MGVLVGLGAGVGLVLIWSAFAVPRRAPRVRRGQTRLRDLLTRAGLRHVSGSAFLAVCGALGCSAALVMQLVTRTAPVALVFGAMGSYFPVVVVSARARR